MNTDLKYPWEYPCPYGKHEITWASDNTNDDDPPKGLTCECGEYTVGQGVENPACPPEVMDD